MNTLVARAAQAADLPALAALLGRPTQLPAAPEALLLVEATPGDASPALPLATARLVPAIGLKQPRLWYHVGCTVHAAADLGLFHRQRTLQLGHDLTGASELCDLAWARDEGLPLDRQAAALQLLVQAAWLWMAQSRRAFAAQLVCELPGLRDSAGQSPFWQGLGRHFYAGDPAAARQAHGPAWRTLVAALLPRQLVYASFLPPAAQAAIGQVDPAARLLCELLEAAGLRYSHHVNLEDAGPVLEAETDQLAGLAAARAWPLGAASNLDPGQAAMAQAWTVASAASPWRAVRARGSVRGAKLWLDAASLALLAARPGDTAWAAPA